MALSANTRATYRTGLAAFKSFCSMHNMGFQGQPTTVPSEEILCLFVCHCADKLGLSYATIKSYLAGVKNAYIEWGLGDPLITPLGQPMLELALVLRGIKKSRQPNKRLRLPITVEILSNLCKRLDGSLHGSYTDALMKAACTLAFFGFLRCGEFTTPTKTFHAEVGICLRDVAIFKDNNEFREVTLTLKQSKTDPFREGCKISFAPIAGHVCPIESLMNYLAMTVPLKPTPHSPLFMCKDGSPLTRNLFLYLLDATCRRSQINPEGYSGHSFRIGAATTAAKCHVPEHIIQVLGRWASTCYKTYIRTSKNTIHWAQQTMSQAGSHAWWHAHVASPICQFQWYDGV